MRIRRGEHERAVVLEGDRVADAGRSRCLVAIAVRHGQRCVERTVAFDTEVRQADRFVMRCAAKRMLQRNVLNQRYNAGVRIDGQSECGRIGRIDAATCRVEAADDEVALLEQEDVTAFGRLQSGRDRSGRQLTARGQSQREDLRICQRGAI